MEEQVPNHDEVLTIFLHGQVLNKSQDQWYQIDDLHIQEILPQVVSISEAYVQVVSSPIL